MIQPHFVFLQQDNISVLFTSRFLPFVSVLPDYSVFFYKTCLERLWECRPAKTNALLHSIFLEQQKKQRHWMTSVCDVTMICDVIVSQFSRQGVSLGNFTLSCKASYFEQRISVKFCPICPDFFCDLSHHQRNVVTQLQVPFCQNLFFILVFWINWELILQTHSKTFPPTKQL